MREYGQVQVSIWCVWATFAFLVGLESPLDLLILSFDVLTNRLGPAEFVRISKSDANSEHARDDSGLPKGDLFIFIQEDDGSDCFVPDDNLDPRDEAIMATFHALITDNDDDVRLPFAHDIESQVQQENESQVLYSQDASSAGRNIAVDSAGQPPL